MTLPPAMRRFIFVTAYGAAAMLLLYGTASLYVIVKDFAIKGKTKTFQFKQIERGVGGGER